MKKNNPAAALLTLAAVIFVIYIPSLSLPILGSWDDDLFITAERIRLSLSFDNLLYYLRHHVTDNYMPVTMYSYMLDNLLWNLAPAGMHLQNVIWHIIAARGLFQCLRLLLDGNIKAAWVIALLFALHPQRVESVSWLAERKDVVCAGFYFWSAWFYLKNRDRKFSFAALALFALSMGAKPMAISLPFVLVLYEFSRSRSFKPGYYLQRFWPYLLVVAIFIPLTFYESRYTGGSLPLSERIFATIHNYVFYAVKTIVPFELNPFYGGIVRTSSLIAWLFAAYALSTGVIVYYFRHNRDFTLYRLLPYLAAYAVSALPIIGLIPLGGIDRADRYSYIPAAILLTGIALWYVKYVQPWAYARPHRQWITGGIAAAFIAVFAVWTWHYQPVWQSVYTISGRASESEPAHPTAMATYGDFLLGHNDLKNAAVLADRLYKLPYAKEDPAMINGFAGYLAGMVCYRQGRYDEALRHFDNALQAQTFFRRYNKEKMILLLGAMADIHFNRGDKGKTVECYNAIIDLENPDSVGFYYFSGLRSFSTGNLAEAVKFLQKAQEKQPDNPRVNNALNFLRQAAIQGQKLKD